MAKREARRVRREFTPQEKSRWEQAIRETEAEREDILNRGRAVLAARRAAQNMLEQLKAERERRGLSLADMMRLTGMTRESISRLENDRKPNPTMLTLARYATALGLELQVSTTRTRRGGP
jgi:DNA-binding XRE family transcriptional regulator